MAQAAAGICGKEKKSLSLRASDGSRPRLLLAEDCDPVRIVTAAMLKAMGCDVEAVVHGEQAVKSASESPFDVIVLDIEMPIMDGITAARSIRSMGGAVAGTPLMALSAFLADSVRTGDWRDTFDIALPKPANRNELHEAVKAALSCQPMPEANAAESMPPLMDEAQFGKLRCGITQPIWRQLSDVACRDIEVCINQLEHVRSGRSDGALLVFAEKLGTLGRTFAARRLGWAAEKVRRARSEAARHEALGQLIASARETVAALRG
ncbi:response regulator [Aestuariivirga sp.]|uniref:response regulator n=1 Tax=Aestuariivirga sp. TaxID=2650926 RepID=UPI00391CD5D8